MLAVIRGLVLGCVLLSLAQMASASDELYRCSDGTFTNRPERQCRHYESKGIVRVQAGTAEVLTSTVKTDAGKEPFAEVKVHDELGKTRSRGQ